MAPPGCFVSSFRGHQPSHPPSRRTTVRPELVEDLVEEVLLRFPASDPAALVRASLVCKDWRRLVSSPGFRRRYRDLHGAAALVGFVLNVINLYGDHHVRYDPASPSSLPRRLGFVGWRALDARHGRVLLCRNLANTYLDVWDPFTGERREVASLPPLHAGYRWNAAVVCAAQGGCDHSHCGGGAFFIILLSENPREMTLRVHLYSSTTSLWTMQTHAGWIPRQGIDDLVTPALVGSTVFFGVDSTRAVLGYHLDAETTVLLEPPTESSGQINTIFPTQEDNLGLASLVRSKISIWAWRAADKAWLPSCSVDIDSLFLFSEFSACTPVLGLILVGTEDGVYELQGGRAIKISHCTGIYSLVPFVAVPSAPRLLAAAEGPNGGGASTE